MDSVTIKTKFGKQALSKIVSKASDNSDELNISSNLVSPLL
jgi:hypothetical protein